MERRDVGRGDEEWGRGMTRPSRARSGMRVLDTAATFI